MEKPLQKCVIRLTKESVRVVRHMLLGPYLARTERKRQKKFNGNPLWSLRYGGRYLILPVQYALSLRSYLFTILQEDAILLLPLKGSPHYKFEKISKWSFCSARRRLRQAIIFILAKGRHGERYQSSNI